MAESHSNYPVLVRFRSPRALSSWLVGLLCVMDSAAMLPLCPSHDRIEPRRAIRMGFTALRDIGAALGMKVDLDPDPDSDIALTFEEFSRGGRPAANGRVPGGEERRRGVRLISGAGASTMRAWRTGWLIGPTRCRLHGQGLVAGPPPPCRCSDPRPGHRGRVARRSSVQPKGQRAQAGLPGRQPTPKEFSKD